MTPALKESASPEIRSAIDQVTADANAIPGCVVVVVNKDGKTLFEHASGKKGAGTQAAMTLDSIFWIASCTKMICGIAAMQLCEQGKLSLDNADKIEEVCPELKEIRILKRVGEDGKPEMVDKKNRITMRMLLTHTAGFGSVLVLQVTYGLTTNLLCMSLNDYFQKNIFQPLGIKNISLFPSTEMKGNLAHMHQRDTNGKIRERDHLLRRPLVVDSDDISRTYNSAGAGCFAKPAEYCPHQPSSLPPLEILATLLSDGISPTTSAHILSPASITEMFTNQIPQFPDFGRRGIDAVKPDLTNPIPELYPQPAEQPQGWGLTFMLTIHPGMTGRGANTAWWAGLSNLYWWCDRERGVAGMLASQVLPFNGDADLLMFFGGIDPNVVGLWAKVEGMVYAGLEEGG
ncbi:MAG: hypothetical protein Q9222_000961 [Ikaeria aurantiellina]